MMNEVKPCYEFGSFHLDLQKRLLLENGVPVELTGKNLEVLAFLIENSKEVVKKEVLLDKFWQNLNTTEGSLTQAIYKIRQALRDTQKPYKYIINQSGEGYQVIATVKRIPTDQIATKSIIEIQRSEPTTDPYGLVRHSDVPNSGTSVTIERIETTEISIPDRPQGILWKISNEFSSLVRRYPRASTATVTGLGLIVISIGTWSAVKHPKPDPIRVPRLTILVNDKSEAGRVRQEGQLSHDGKMLAYSSIRDGRTGIWVKQISNSNPIPVTENAICWSPRWSPNDLYLAYLSSSGNQIALWTKPALGGEATLITIFGSDPISPGTTELRAWSTKDPSKIYVERFHNLLRLDLNTKQIEQITSFDLSKDLPGDFEVSPDEKMITYDESKNNLSQIFCSKLNGTSPFSLSDPRTNSIHPEWLSDGSAVIYASRVRDSFQLFITNIADRSTRQLTSDTEDHYVTSVSANGITTVDATRKDQAHVWGVNLATHNETLYTTEGGVQIWPEPVPGSEKIIYQSLGSGVDVLFSEIMSRELSGSKKTSRLVLSGGFVSVSPKGDQFAFLRFRDGKINLWTASLTDGTERQLTTDGIDGSAYTIFPMNPLIRTDSLWSPNGKEIIFRSVKDYIPNLWKVSLETGIQTQITDNKNKYLQYTEVRFSPDGKKLAYVTIETNKGGDRNWSLIIQDNGATRTICQRDKALRLLGWLPHGESVVFASDEIAGEHTSVPTNLSLSVISIKGGEPKSIPPINSGYLLTAAISPNGQEVALVCRHDGTDNIWISSLTDSTAQMVTGNVDPMLYLTGLAWSPDGNTIFFSKQESTKIISLIDNLF